MFYLVELIGVTETFGEIKTMHNVGGCFSSKGEAWDFLKSQGMTKHDRVDYSAPRPGTWDVRCLTSAEAQAYL